MQDIVEITTTVESEQQALSLAETLVHQRLAACVQITGPIHSVYRWQGNVESSREYRCTIKSEKSMISQLMVAIQSHHPYDVPEILVVEVVRSSDAYAAWLHDELRSGDDPNGSNPK